MYLTSISSRISGLAIAVCMIVGFTSVANADPAGMTGTHDFHAMMPAGCGHSGHDGTQEGTPPTREEMMRKLTEELNLTGQQQQDLQILMADYGERLGQLAQQMRVSGEKLMTTEPGDPYYWPLAQEVSASAASSAGETVILVSEMREKIYRVLTADQRTEIKRRIEARKAQCKSHVEAEADQPAG